MVFSSGVFLLVFLPITFIANLFLSTKQSNIWLLIASLLFVIVKFEGGTKYN